MNEYTKLLLCVDIIAVHHEVFTAGELYALYSCNIFLCIIKTLTNTSSCAS